MGKTNAVKSIPSLADYYYFFFFDVFQILYEPGLEFFYFGRRSCQLNVSIVDARKDSVVFPLIVG